MSLPATSTRRQLLVLAAAVVAPWKATAQAGVLDAAVLAFTGGKPAAEGRVQIEVPALVENGNLVPITVRVDSPMSTADRVEAIAVFNERNPQRDVAVFTLGPLAAKAEVATRIRLATSQNLVAVARLADGSHWQQRVNVVVTLAACIEGDV